MRKPLLVVLGLGITLSGCASATSPPSTHRAPVKITARFRGPTGVARVSAVQFAGARNGWFGVEEVDYASGQAVAGSTRLMSTTDGGSTWTPAAKTPGPIRALQFLSPQQGFVLVADQNTLTLYSTSDGGHTLREVSSPPGSAGDPELRLRSPSQGFLVVGDRLDVTTDGGRTWQSRVMSLPGTRGGQAQSAPYFLSPSVGFLIRAGSVYRTKDGGTNWDKVYSLPKGIMTEGGNLANGPVAFASPQLGYAAFDIPNCWAGGCPVVIVRTRDGGARWRTVSGASQGPLPGLGAPMTGPPGGVGAILASGQDEVVASTMDGLAVSSDGGVRWTSPTTPQISSPGNFTVLASAGGAGVLAAGAFLLQRSPQGVWRTDWPAPVPTTDITFASNRVGYGIATQPLRRLLETKDGGSTWRTVGALPSSAIPIGLSFSDARRGWLVADAQAGLYATSDGGLRWRALGKSAVTGQLLGSSTGVALVRTGGPGGPLALVATSDSGQHFAPRALPKDFPDAGLVRFASARRAFALAQASPPGLGIRLWETSDGGRIWRRLTPPKALAKTTVLNAFATDQAGDFWLLALLRNGTRTSEVLYLHSGGGRWQEIRMPSFTQFAWNQPLAAVSATTAWLATPAGVFLTTDGGRVWRNLTSPLPG